jgi:hypothetical protein
MALISCKICGRLFNSLRGELCTRCLDEVEAVYPRLREYIREQPKKEPLYIERIAKVMQLDVLFIESLVDMGYLDQYADRLKSEKEEEAQNREAVFRTIRESMSVPAAPRQAQPDKHSKMYSQDRYKSSRR